MSNNKMWVQGLCILFRKLVLLRGSSFCEKARTRIIGCLETLRIRLVWVKTHLPKWLFSGDDTDLPPWSCSPCLGTGSPGPWTEKLAESISCTVRGCPELSPKVWKRSGDLPLAPGMETYNDLFVGSWPNRWRHYDWLPCLLTLWTKIKNFPNCMTTNNIKNQSILFKIIAVINSAIN